MSEDDREQPPPESHGEDLALRLEVLIAAVERSRSAVSRALGVGTTECQAIGQLRVHGPQGQTELARRLGLSSSAATALVDRLVEHGVGERLRHSSDRRRFIVQLTTRGEWLASEGHQRLRDVTDSLPASDPLVLSDWFDLVTSGLERHSS